MDVNFYKYQGSGNDFIIIDDRKKLFTGQQVKLFSRLCNRRFGIGADGLILIHEHPDHDFKMTYYNADGNEGSMCGNGGRCAVAFMNNLGVISERTDFIAFDGPHEAIISKDGIINLKMSDVKDVVIREDNYFLDTGSPHYVTFVNDLRAVDVVKIGREIRYSDRFKEQGINVNFVEADGKNTTVRTYERGVEDETLSCGTGVVASAIATSIDKCHSGEPQKIIIETQGGNLSVAFESANDHNFTNVWLEGPAKFVYKGQLSI